VLVTATAVSSIQLCTCCVLILSILGGPLTVVRNGESLQIGIASFVSGAGCLAGHPTAFARVTEFVPWIGHQ